MLIPYHYKRKRPLCDYIVGKDMRSTHAEEVHALCGILARMIADTMFPLHVRDVVYTRVCAQARSWGNGYWAEQLIYPFTVNCMMWCDYRRT